MGEGEIVVKLSRVIEELRGFADRVSRVLGLRSLVVFGSYARGEALRDSDVDVIVVAEAFRGLYFYEREYMVHRLYRGSLPLEPWCYTPEEVVESLEQRPRLDIVDAVDYGVVVYDDGFWEELRSRYRGRYRRTWYGGLKIG